MFTITITAEETATKWISLLVSTVQTMLGEAEVPEINISLQRVKRGPRSQVMYHPVADASVLNEIGRGTVVGILFAELLNKPMTAADLFEKRGFTNKSVQSALHKMKTMGIVESRPIEAVE